jgi:3-oxoacyl-[acyl-carrier protein] reductase
MKLQNISSIVTGGGRGIGRAISLKIASEGADVAIVAEKDMRSAEETAEQIRQLGRKAIAIRADVSNPEMVSGMVSKVLESFGRIDLLINNAAISLRAPLEQLSVENWDRVMAVNLKGIFLCGVAVAREMIKQNKGCIINMAAASGHRSYGGGGAVGPSKAGVISLTKQMAVEWAKYNIRVNGVSPGPIMTAETEERIKDENTKRRIGMIPLRRVGRPEEIAAAVLFLASEDSSYMTGQILIVDGGGVETWYLYP